MGAVTIGVKMDIEKIMREKIEKPSKRVFFSLAKTVFQYIAIDSQSVGGMYGSPVLTGRYFSSHNASLNAVDTSVKAEGNYPSGASVSEVTDLESRFNLGDELIISNSLDYASKIEFNMASPTKTPEGVYRVSAEAAKVKFSTMSLGGLLNGG